MLAMCTVCLLETKSDRAGERLSRILLGTSLGEKVTFDLCVPSFVLYLATWYVLWQSFRMSPTVSSGSGDLALTCCSLVDSN